MSQTDFRGLRKRSNDPMTQLFIELQKKYIRYLIDQQLSDLDSSDNEDIYYVDEG